MRLGAGSSGGEGEEDGPMYDDESVAGDHPEPQNLEGGAMPNGKIFAAWT